jgi:hypothetical protein
MIKRLTLLVVMFFVSIPVFAESVDTAWVRRYDGPASSGDSALAMAMDRSGNIYVTGFSTGNGTGRDYTTIKYYPDGDTAWVRRYDGPGNGGDIAYGIVVDDLGNVYVTGWVWVAGADYDYVTIKYYPNGDTAWARTYNGPGDNQDQAFAIAVDDSGNVYVTGFSMGTSTNSDYATIKYLPDGDTAWVRRYNGSGNGDDIAYGIVVDDSGNVYVTGWVWVAGADYDYATIKYYPNGDTAWVRTYNGPGDSRDWAFALAVDAPENVYVTGRSRGSGTDYDYATIKYYPNGDTAWVRTYNGPGNSGDEAYGIAVDDSGNIYVTGQSWGSGTDYDYATIKYRSNGDTVWVRRYNGTGNGWDAGDLIALDDSYSVYVIGISWGNLTDFDYATIKYYPNGDTAWAIRYNGPGNGTDQGNGIAVDGSGNVYVAGYSQGIGTGTDYAIIKYVQTDNVVDEPGYREAPSEFTLSQNYPNPFNASTKIEFALKSSGFVSLNIYDILGRKVRTLVSGDLPIGHKSVLWDGKDDSGNNVASGTYFCKLKTKHFSEAKKSVLLK